jgi:hypothetical protein
MDLVRYVKAIKDKSRLKVIKKHLALLGAGGFGVAATYTHQQSHASAIRMRLEQAGIAPLPPEILKDASRKTIELMIGLAALNTFDEVTIEDPEESNAKDPNPDIIISWRNARFGIACKSINSTNKSNLRERISEGLIQIDRSIECGKVDNRRGVVLLDISALLDHDALYVPSEDSVWFAKDLTEILWEAINRALAKVFGSGPSKVKGALGDLFENHQAAPCVLIYAHTLMIAAAGDSICPRYMKLMRLLFAGDHSKVKGFAEKLNTALHCQ